jgi:hypothetical protein
MTLKLAVRPKFPIPLKAKLRPEFMQVTLVYVSVNNTAKEQNMNSLIPPRQKTTQMKVVEHGIQ